MEKAEACELVPKLNAGTQKVGNYFSFFTPIVQDKCGV